MEEETSRLTRETTSGSEGKVGGNQEVGEVGSVDLSGDSMVVAGRAGVFQDSLAIGSNPERQRCRESGWWFRGSGDVAGFRQ
jgi:hypothetical protein